MDSCCASDPAEASAEQQGEDKDRDPHVSQPSEERRDHKERRAEPEEAESEEELGDAPGEPERRL